MLHSSWRDHLWVVEDMHKILLHLYCCVSYLLASPLSSAAHSRLILRSSSCGPQPSVLVSTSKRVLLQWRYAHTCARTTHTHTHTHAHTHTHTHTHYAHKHSYTHYAHKHSHTQTHTHTHTNTHTQTHTHTRTHTHTHTHTHTYEHTRVHKHTHTHEHTHTHTRTHTHTLIFYILHIINIRRYA